MTIQVCGQRSFDVFGDDRFGRNHLPAFARTEGLSGPEMQRIVPELGPSGREFAVAPVGRTLGWALRIFTPLLQSPVAGSQTLGAAITLVRDRQSRQGARIRLAGKRCSEIMRPQSKAADFHVRMVRPAMRIGVDPTTGGAAPAFEPCADHEAGAANEASVSGRAVTVEHGEITIVR